VSADVEACTACAKSALLSPRTPPDSFIARASSSMRSDSMMLTRCFNTPRSFDTSEMSARTSAMPSFMACVSSTAHGGTASSFVVLGCSGGSARSSGVMVLLRYRARAKVAFAQLLMFV
jgi:hypothetical protein